jgi:gamma-glutamylcyclotransferase
MAVLYFAYGSNMLTQRLLARVPSARAVGAAALVGHRLAFVKPSIDGSGKADVVTDARATTHGVLFELKESELAALDKFEGADYQRVPITVRTGLTPVDAVSYIAKDGKRDLGLLPYCWYLGVVRAGAMQHELPSQHIEFLRTQRFSIDPVADRKTKAAALDSLDASGYRHLWEEMIKQQ